MFKKHREVTIIKGKIAFLLIIPLRDSLRLLMGRRIMKGGEEAKEYDPNFKSNIIQENQHFHLAPVSRYRVSMNNACIRYYSLKWFTNKQNEMIVTPNHLDALHALSIHLHVRNSL